MALANRSAFRLPSQDVDVQRERLRHLSSEMRDIVLTSTGSWTKSKAWTEDPNLHDRIREGAEAAFRILRSDLMQADLWDCDPPLVLRQSKSLATYIKKLRAFNGSIADAFDDDVRPLFESLGGDPNDSAEPKPATEESVFSQSSSWTGRRTVSEIVQAVRNMVPVAQEALQLLIEEEERRRHNNPPEPLENEALENLRNLHAELGELLRAAEAGQNLGRRLKALMASANRIFKGSERYGIVIEGLEVVGLSLIPAYAAVKALEFIFGHQFDIAAEGIISAAMIAVTHQAKQRGGHPLRGMPVERSVNTAGR